MANPKFIFQGIRQNNDHEGSINTFLDLKNLKQIIISVAFVRESGVRLLQNIIKKYNQHTIVYVGIRNGITSAQGLLALLKLRVTLYCVDTGSTATIFHPKIYSSFNDLEGRIIIGSANLTQGGLIDNIEASTMIILNRKDNADETFLSDIVTSVTTLQKNFPDHVFIIKKKSDIIKLLKEGRIADERISHPKRLTNDAKEIKRDQLTQIKLFRKKIDRIIKPSKRLVIPLSKDGWNLMWISRGLTERDLNIPTGNNTNPTGSMLFKKGKMDSIDQRSYFRKLVFNHLKWHPDSKSSLRHLERSEAEFDVVVKGINLGTFKMKLTHNSRTDSTAFAQLNAMTQIHWGNVKSYIAQKDLLRRELKLYRHIHESNRFLIEID